MTPESQLKALAVAKSGPFIRPPDRKTWEESFTIINNRRLLWYNTPDGSTHVVQLPLEPN